MLTVCDKDFKTVGDAYKKEHRNCQKCLECIMKIIVINKKINNTEIGLTINKLLNELEK